MLLISLFSTISLLAQNACPGTPTVTDYDGNVYNTVLIIDQCWMKENLNVGSFTFGYSDPAYDEQINNGVIQKFCYENIMANCDTFGGLYTWNEMLNYSIQNQQGICPNSWHIATDTDWLQLLVYEA